MVVIPFSRSQIPTNERVEVIKGTKVCRNPFQQVTNSNLKILVTKGTIVT